MGNDREELKNVKENRKSHSNQFHIITFQMKKIVIDRSKPAPGTFDKPSFRSYTQQSQKFVSQNLHFFKLFWRIW